ncbi:class I SAM-dependent methyltransferase [Olivibacter jilunii]|uniref:class I SAM-dependent methyltransferase n=1 Tax=Olivibacter jilunii TaxID=985016 RepID=UPI003F14D3E9
MSKQNFWDDYYKNGSYLLFWDYQLPSQELVTFLATENMAKQSKCLDIGSGGGNDAIFMAQCGYEVTGLDISNTALEISAQRARKSNVKLNWVHDDILSAPFSGEYFDFISDRGCFHHISDEQRPAYATQILRILKPGGKLLLRGSSSGKSGVFFNKVNETVIDNFFHPAYFSRGPVLPISILADRDILACNIVVLTKK